MLTSDLRRRRMRKPRRDLIDAQSWLREDRCGASRPPSSLAFAISRGPCAAAPSTPPRYSTLSRHTVVPSRFRVQVRRVAPRSPPSEPRPPEGAIQRRVKRRTLSAHRALQRWRTPSTTSAFCIAHPSWFLVVHRLCPFTLWTVIQGGKERFCHGVIITYPGSPDRLPDPMFDEGRGEAGRGVVTAPVAVKPISA